MRRVAIAILAAVIAAAVSFFTIPLWLTFTTNIAREGSRTDWLGFIGSVMGAMVALIAAIIAWFAVQAQIRAQKREAKKWRIDEEKWIEHQHREAKEAAVIVLMPIVQAAADAFNAIGKASPHEVEARKLKFERTMKTLKATMGHFAMAQAWQGLGLEDKTNYLIVTTTLHTVMTIHDNSPSPIEDERAHIASIRNQHDLLSKLAVYLRAFDDGLADVYERQAKVQLP
jgi:hypothetical protein